MTSQTFYAQQPPLAPEIMASLAKYPKEDVVDGCVAAAHVAYAASDASFIYPITPSSPMAEIYEVWSAQNRKNIFGQTCIVRQMQSEAGAAGAVHGSLSVGAITTTFTASQGLLLMIPPMYKIAGELIPCVFHVSARALAGQALSIFGDHSDVMAVRQCGWAMLSSSSVQESQDLAVISHMSTLKARVPFVHFFDGFRTSHEIQKIQVMDYATIRSLIDFEKVEEFRKSAMNPTRPYAKGTAQGPEVFFQNVEVANKYYNAVPGIIEEAMDMFAKVTGRQYKLFDYYGSADAEEVLVIMGAGAHCIQEVLDHLASKGDTRTGLIAVKLYRPWKVEKLLEALPSTIKRVCVLDRTKEPGALGEPLFLDVAASLQSQRLTHISCYGGRYGLGSKDFTPAMVMGVIDNIRSENPKHGFVIGIEDDLTHLSLPFKHHVLETVPEGTTQALFWGMGSDGTVGANKNVIKIIGNATPLHVQGYFAYSAHKEGGITVSHLRFGKHQIRSQYLLQQADYVAIHRHVYIKKYEICPSIKQDGILLLNAPWTAEELNDEIPAHVRKIIAQKNAKLYLIDANKVAAENGMGRRTNNVLMTSFFKLSGVLPFEEAIKLFKAAIQKTYGKKGQHVVEANWKCVDAAFDATKEITYDKEAWLKAEESRAEKVWSTSGAIPTPPTFVQGVMHALEKLEGENLPTSIFADYAGGILPAGTAGFEKRAIALSVPIVDMDKCTQCNHCAFVCPHAAIRPFLIDDDDAEKAPAEFTMKKCKAPSALAAFRYRIQVAPLDCTGCELCAIACPDDALKMTALEEVEKVETPNWDFAIKLKDRSELLSEDQRTGVKGSQFFTPMIEFSGACAGCGETPYLKLLTQIFGERLVIANATGCSSILAASYPANAYTVNQKGYGPAWGNSLFEDNAEFGFGMACATAHRREKLRDSVELALKTEECTNVMSAELRSYLAEWLLNWLDAATCARVFDAVKDLLEVEKVNHPMIQNIATDKEVLIRISQWIIGGDGWAYDIGFGGLDHVFASGVDVNVLVLDTEVYSNTGGQMSKATTLGAVHKFAAGGRLRNKKDLGALAMEYGDVYTASISSSANMTQTVRAFVEAEAYPGTSVIIAYAPCIEHNYIQPFNLQLEHCKLAVESGYWPLYRYNPSLQDNNENPFQLDSRKLKAELADLMKKENRFGILRRQNPKLAAELELKLQDWVSQRFERLKARAAGPQKAQASEKNPENVWNIVYGTETGNCEEVAKRMGKFLKEREYDVEINGMDDLALEDFTAMKRVLVLCSTQGQGEFPASVRDFWHALEKETDPKLLENMSFSVMGLGDSNYVFFNQSAKNLDKKLAELGAHRITALGNGDDCDEEGYETGLAEWLGNLTADAKLPEPKNILMTPSEPSFEVSEVPAGEYKPCVHLGGTMVNLKKNVRMTPEDYEVNVMHLEWDLSGTGMKYGLGDSLAIYPRNLESDVEEFCNYFGFNPDQWIQMKGQKDSSAKLSALFKEPMTVRQLLTECLDISGKPGRSFYENFWRYCADETEKATARAILLNENRETLMLWAQKETASIFDVIRKFPSSKSLLTIPHLIELLPVIKVKYYSIASSQRFVGADNLHNCIGLVEWKDSLGRARMGQCTGYLARCLASEENKIPFCVTLKATAFNLPPNDMCPIIVAGMGTGLAPFRAFIQHRAWLKQQGKPHGPTTVYFGCRYAKKDFLYGDELMNYAEAGVISELKTAFSRDQQEKFYIQHAILSDPALFYRRMVTEDGYFYLCGSAKQVPIDIRNAVRKVLCSEGKMEEKAAEELITHWQIIGKYNTEAW